MNHKKAITEKMHLEKEWFEQARRQTLETLLEFINHVMNDYCHDYGTICHAVSACALAAVYAANHHPSGGITGFQAGFVMWDVIRQMNYPSNKCGMKLMDYDNMLYPQYAHKFEKTIAPNTWKSLQEAAREKIEQEGEYAHPEVLKHWKSIADGTIPFGYQIEENKV